MFRPQAARNAYAFTAAILYTVALASASLLSAQSLPAPSRTMYKCKVNGTTTYSDTPCLGATRLEIEPSRGVSKLSGKERLGNDVVNERHREMLAEAIRPLSGMDAKQYATFSRRYQLPSSAQRECRALDQELPLVEQEEKHAAQSALRDVQMRLFVMRKRFQELGC